MRLEADLGRAAGAIESVGAAPQCSRRVLRQWSIPRGICLVAAACKDASRHRAGFDTA